MRKWLLVLMVGILSTSVTALADTVQLTFEGTGGTSNGGYYVYPYNMSVNGSSTTVPMLTIRSRMKSKTARAGRRP